MTELDSVMAVVTRNIAREHNALKSDIQEIRRTFPVYQRGDVQSVDPASGTAVVQLRGVDTNPLVFLSPYIPLVGDDVMLLQVGTDMIIMGPLRLDVSWHDVTGGEFQNGWVNYGLDAQVARWRRTADAGMRVEGVIKSGTINTAAFTLPFAPTGRLLYPASTGPNTFDNYGRVDVNTSGDLIPVAGSPDFMSFSLKLSLY